MATGLSAMVCVGGETGARKPDPVPESVRPFLEESEEATAAAADSAAMMEGFPLAADVVGETYVYKTRIRYSVRASAATEPLPPFQPTQLAHTLECGGGLRVHCRMRT